MTPADTPLESNGRPSGDELTPRRPLGWLDDVDANRQRTPDARRDSTVAVLEERLADTERRRIAAEVRIRMLEDERERLTAENRERVGLFRRIERLRSELARHHDDREEMERELNESRFRRFDHETALGALRDAEAVRDASQAMLALLADRLSGVADGTRAITRRELRRLVELIDLPPLQALPQLTNEVASSDED